MNVLQLAERHVTLKRVSSNKGGEYQGPCPKCGGTDRFHVWPEDKEGAGGWWCRQCKSGGDAVQFLIDFEGMSFPEACAALGRDLPAESPVPVAPKPKKQAPDFTPRQYADPADLWREQAEKFVAKAHQRLLDLPESAPARRWLAKRGIDAETIARFRLGWLPEHRFPTRESWGLETITKENGKPKKLFIPRGIVIPSPPEDGPVYRIRIRKPNADISEKYPQKYYVLERSRMSLPVIGAEKKAFVVVEAELDAMMIHRFAGDLVGAVATMTSHAKPDDQAHRALSAAAAILVALDFDHAGTGGWDWWRHTYRDAERWPPAVGKDPGEAYEKGLDIRTWILAGLPPAWHIEAPGKNKPKPPKQKPAPVQLQAPALPETLAELEGILRKYPIRARVVPGWTSLLVAPGFRNEAVIARASDLVFRENACWDFLYDHPADIVDGRNFASGMR